MNPTRTIVLLLATAAPLLSHSSQPVDHKPIKLQLHGQVEARAFYNGYRSRTYRDGVQYAYPLPPEYDPSGKDLNQEGFLGFSVLSSRLSLKATGPRLGKAAVSAFLEADFMGGSNDILHTFRLRHAWIKLQWKHGLLLLGQTDHLSRVDEVSPRVVAYGSGTPFNTQNRSGQIRYARRFGRSVELLSAAHVYTGSRGVGPEEAQNRACIPDMQLQVKLGDPKRVFGGFTAGYKSFKPLSKNAAGYRVNRRAGSYNAGAFFKAVYRDYSLKIWGMVGQNLTPYSMIGGYGPRPADAGSDPFYTNISVLTAWADLETPVFGRFQAGLFAGYQKNLGADRSLERSAGSDHETVFSGYFRDNALSHFFRISPRIYYCPLHNLTFGLEYLFSQARWGTDFNARYQARKHLPASSDHRLELLARFNF